METQPQWQDKFMCQKEGWNVLCGGRECYPMGRSYIYVVIGMVWARLFCYTPRMKCLVQVKGSFNLTQHNKLRAFAVIIVNIEQVTSICMIFVQVNGYLNLTLPLAFLELQSRLRIIQNLVHLLQQYSTTLPHFWHGTKEELHGFYAGVARVLT